MKSKRLYSGLMALGLACTLIFQTPVLAAEETAETQTSSLFLQGRMSFCLN